MKKVKVVFFFILLFLLIIISNPSYAMEQTILHLNFSVKIQENGSVSVTEIWDTSLNDTNTLYKTFDKDSKSKKISDVTVSELDENHNIIKNFINSEKYNYHEPKDYFHATKDKKGNFEIAWGVSANGHEKRIFKINYTINDCINVYNDCAEFYWQLIGKKWDIETYDIYGTVILPSKITNDEDFRIWAHGPQNGSIHKISDNAFLFYLSKMPTKTFLELRLVFPTNIVKDSTNRINKNKLDKILKEEQDFANSDIEKEITSKKYSYIGIALYIIISGVFIYIEIKKLINTKKEINKLDYFKGKANYIYYRDIPNDKMDPVEASLLAFNSISDKNMITSLIMSLAYKNAITIKPSDKPKNTEIFLDIFENNNYSRYLTDGEQALVNYFKKIGNNFSIRELENYININANSFNSLLNDIRENSKNNLENNYYQYINKYLSTFVKKINDQINTSFTIMLIYFSFSSFFIGLFPTNNLGIAYIFTLMLTIIFYIVSSIFTSKMKNGINIYTKIGTEERAKWRGLMNFLVDFSMIDQREIPELELWEQYLVYATGFGIANKVLKQLKARFPEIASPEFINNYTWFYFANNISINRPLSSNSTSRSRYGFGGGFSSGGGGGAGGGGRWRKIKNIIFF